MLDALLGLLVIAAAFCFGWLAHLVRSNRVSQRAAMASAVLCSVALILMVLSDWPIEVLAGFWAEHSVLAGMLSSLLLVAIVFLVYERGEQQRQDKLADGLTGAGLGGVVDHMVDVELALAFVSLNREPSVVSPEHWGQWRDPGKPLRWMREGRHLLGTEGDPRLAAVEGNVTAQPWMPELIDQAIRRLLAGMRDWTPLIGSSEAGVETLLIVSRIRSDLMGLSERLVQQDAIPLPPEEVQRMLDLRRRLRVLAACFEDWSGAPTRRSEVLETSVPLVGAGGGFGQQSRTLRERLETVAIGLGFTK